MTWWGGCEGCVNRDVGEIAMDDTVIDRSPDDHVTLASGTLIGRYVVRSVLGQGTFGITYLAHDGQLGRDVAIKEYLPTAFAVRHAGGTVVPNSLKVAEVFAWGRQRFIDEGRTLAGFRRMPGMVHVYDLVEDHGTAYIVMELVHGSTLEKKLARDGLSPQDVDRLLPLLLDVLAAVHGAGFVHRDIKPENIHIDQMGRVKLMDFGIAKAHDVSLTRAGFTLGTPYYMSPEQVLGQAVTPQTDVYCFGVLLYEMLASVRPFQGPGYEKIFQQIVHEPASAQPLRDARVPEPVIQLVMRLLAKQPLQRPNGFTAICGEIDGIVARLVPVKAKATPAPPVAVPAKTLNLKSPAILIALSALAVLALLGLIFLIVSRFV